MFLKILEKVVRNLLEVIQTNQIEVDRLALEFLIKVHPEAQVQNHLVNPEVGVVQKANQILLVNLEVAQEAKEVHLVGLEVEVVV